MENLNEAVLSYSSVDQQVSISFSEICRYISLRVFYICGKTFTSEKHVNRQNISFFLPKGIVKGLYLVDIIYDKKRQIEKIIL